MTKRQDQPFDDVERPRHYNSHPSGIEPIDVIRYMTLAVGNAVKYVVRCALKGGRQDLDKARWFLTDAVQHRMPVWAVAAHAEALHKLYTMAQYETGRRRDLLLALHGDDVRTALECAVDLLREWPNEQQGQQD